MDKRSLLSIIAESTRLTPAQALFSAARASGLVNSKREFADLVATDLGNIYNYLASAERENRIPAKVETLRRWGDALTHASDGAVRVSVSQDPRGETVVFVETTEDGRRTELLRHAWLEKQPSSRPFRAATRRSHAHAHEDSRRACESLVACLRAFRPEVQLVHGPRGCTLRCDGNVGVVEHDANSKAVRVLVAVPPSGADTLERALQTARVPYENGRARKGSTGRIAVLVGEGGVSPQILARGVVTARGWWAPGTPASDAQLTDEVAPAYLEGARTKVFVNRYERNREAREACIARFQARCVACELAYPEVYGGLGEGYIHVHHLRPLHEIGEDYVVDPVRDLVPVCANCHAMIHLDPKRPLSIDALRVLLGLPPLEPQG